MRNSITYLVLCCSLAVSLAACSGKNDPKKLPKLTETYSKKDTKPFGASITYSQLEAMFDGNVIRDKKQVFSRTWQDISDTGALYVCITPRLFVNEEDIEAMLEYVEYGNSLFISAGYIDEALLDKINAAQFYSNPAIERMIDHMENTGASTVQAVNKYEYYYYTFKNYFTKFDSSSTRVLGYNATRKPNSIVYFHGKGKLFLHCEPRVFSNYFQLTKNNHQYLRQALAYAPAEPQHVYWDDYYNKQRRKSEKGFSTFSEIMKHPPLAFAFWLALALLILYVLFAGKRRQRIIRQLKPNENTTVTFTETIGRLYLQKKDNKNIADKMVTYFNEYIRNTYFLNTNQVNDDFIIVLSRKSGVEKGKVEILYRTIADTQSSSIVTDYQLLSLHEQVQAFYKNKT